MSLKEVYHATSLYAAYEIVKTQKIRLSGMAGKKAERETGSKRGYLYFLSLTRSKIGGYHTRTSGNNMALIVFDYDGLHARYKIEPVDYWGPEFRKGSQSSNEMEERLFANQQYISANGKIKAIHVLHAPDKWTEDKDRAQLRQLMIECKKRGIKIHVYDKANKWRTMRPSLALKLTDIDLHGAPNIKGGSRMYKRNWMTPYLNLYFAPRKTALNKEGDRLRYNIYYSQYRLDEAKRQLENDLHNAATKPEIARISGLIQKEGGLDKFFNVLVEKAKKLSETA